MVGIVVGTAVYDLLCLKCIGKIRSKVTCTALKLSFLTISSIEVFDLYVIYTLCMINMVISSLPSHTHFRL